MARAATIPKLPVGVADATSRVLVDPSAEETLRDFLIDGETLQWAQPSLAEPERKSVWNIVSDVFWLGMMAAIIAYGGAAVMNLAGSDSWPDIEFLLGLACVAVGVPIFALVVKSYFEPRVDRQMVFAITDRRVFSLNSRTQDRTSLMGGGRYHASVSVEKTTSNMGSLTLRCDVEEDFFHMEMRSVREVDAAERLIIASFGRSEQDKEVNKPVGQSEFETPH